MPRYRCLIEYDGRPYKGFQAQGDHPTVQASLERAILGFSGEALRITAAGRTDTGVHATGQVVSFDLSKAFKADTVRDAMNAFLAREPVSVLAAEQVDDEFSARFSATGRMYLYRILTRRAPPALDMGRVWHVKKPLDAEVMAQAAKALVGTHDFTTFRHVECQAKSPVKTLDIARVKRFGDEIHLVFAARSFLHRQVRSMTGTLVEAGIGRWDIADVAEALAAKDRAACGQVAPPEGLYLTHVTYEAEPDFGTYSSI
ncbi:tRNA pseudouridine synthase A [Asticcacaulis biprosthecium C19]|uniref:tRNA pseudouridine synthase A n=1 Tax=Asticcacaulis biprosthecium C19 TaxID=715226 RepID=F4QNN7_9CAUL|nr:tRNA pseudouridine(38-40) synthase TruA [Asticcacaulis biprosthecium]EGF90945.1 tRNA pseudouridine synthase A [Asticcacaulis biprosthecium C19]